MQGRGGIDCYCFGAGGQPLGKATLIKQVTILALLTLVAPTAGPIPLLKSGFGGDVGAVGGVAVFVLGAWGWPLSPPNWCGCARFHNHAEGEKPVAQVCNLRKCELYRRGRSKSWKASG